LATESTEEHRKTNILVTVQHTTETRSAQSAFLSPIRRYRSAKITHTIVARFYPKKVYHHIKSFAAISFRNHSTNNSKQNILMTTAIIFECEEISKLSSRWNKMKVAQRAVSFSSIGISRLMKRKNLSFLCVSVVSLKYFTTRCARGTEGTEGFFLFLLNREIPID